MTDRPFRLEWIDPRELIVGAHPANWRRHDATQRAAFEGLLAEVGWADALLFNERTGKLLDGHMRLEQAAANRLPAVPVLIGDWDEPTERKILASRDTLGLGADIDAAKFADLLRGVDTGSAEMAGLWADLAEEWGAIPPDEDVAAEGAAEDEPAEEAEDFEAADGDDVMPDVVFPSDDEWGIPPLDVRLQGDAPQFPLTVWRTQGRRKPMPGTWLFYSADCKFEPLWKDPGAILASGPTYVVEPNFSTHPQTPAALVLWNTYRKRTLARWWQSKGLRVFVDLCVCPEFRDINFRGVPPGWRAYATRIADGHGLDEIEADWRAAADHSGTEDLAFLVYGGGPKVKARAIERGWFWTPDQCHTAREKSRAGKKGGK